MYRPEKDGIDIMVDDIKAKYLFSSRLYGDILEKITGHSEELYLRDKFETYKRMREK